MSFSKLLHLTWGPKVRGGILVSVKELYFFPSDHVSRKSPWYNTYFVLFLLQVAYSRSTCWSRDHFFMQFADEVYKSNCISLTLFKQYEWNGWCQFLDHYTLINHLKVIFSQTNCVKDSWFWAQKDLGYQRDGVQITQTALFKKLWTW